MDTAVVTGGAGFIGSHLVTRLLEEGLRVVAFDDLSTGYERNLAHVRDDVELVVADIRDRDALDRAFAGARYVFHEAAMVSVAQSVESPVECDAINGRGTLDVLLAAKQAGVERVMFAASAAAYGRSEALPKQESMAPDAVSPYAATKLLGEHYARTFTASYDLPVFPLRYFNIYGPRQDPSGMYAGVISKFVDRMTAHEIPLIFGDGKQTRDFCFVGDVVDANLLAMRAPADRAGWPINIGTGQRTSLLDLVRSLNRVLGTSLEPEFREERAGDVRHSVADITRAQTWLGYRPQTSLDDGLAALVASVRGAA